jgi:Transposase IS116/IS110/IS902 family
VATRLPEPAVPQRLDVDRTRIDADDRWLTDLKLARVRTAQAPEAQTCYRLRSIPGIGHILARVRLEEIQAIRRVPRVPDLVASGRLVTGANASAGTRDGTSGQQIGHADRTWACSEAAVRFLRHHPAGQQYRARLTKPPGQGQAWTVLAHQRARAVSDL